MTYREKLAQEHPLFIDAKLEGGCAGCPYTYGYEDTRPPCIDIPSLRDCRACWDREMPLTAQEAHDLEINAEIIRGYCDTYESCVVCPADATCHDGEWGSPCFKPGSQRVMLDAFEAALPPEDDTPDAVPRDIPQVVRATVEARIMELSDQVVALNEQIQSIKAERDELIYWRNAQEADHGT